MKIFKPDSLAIIYKALNIGGSDVMSLGMMAIFEFDHLDSPHLLPEAELWTRVDRGIGPNSVIDIGYPKPSAEFLSYGAGYAPGGSPVTELPVAITVGTITKKLIVRGNRQANSLGVVSRPEPFTRMPIDQIHAFGGRGCGDNPVGKGYVGIGDAGAVSLPNVELPVTFKTMVSASQVPAGFWALDVSAATRLRCLGRADRLWMEETWPALPVDTAPEFFHSAPEDQRFEGYLRGDEPIEILNMHPEHMRLASRLPGLRARCFVHQLCEGEPVFREVDARAETVWLFPGMECGIVLYRAVVRTADSEAEDVLQIKAAWEMLDEKPLPFEHYREEFLCQIDSSISAPRSGADAAEDNRAVDTARVSSAVPSASQDPSPVSASSMEELSAETSESDAMEAELARLSTELERRKSELLRVHGLTEADLRAMYPPAQDMPVITDAEMEELSARLMNEVRQSLQKRGLTEDSVPNLMRVPVSTAATEGDLIGAARLMREKQQALLRDHQLTERDVLRFIQSRPDLARIARAYQQENDIEAALRFHVPPVATSVTGPDIEQFRPTETMREATSGDAADSTMRYFSREDVIEAHLARISFVEADLRGLDLSGVDLSGGDFAGALLDGTSFANARLERANFRSAILQEADFSGADLNAAVMSNASAEGSIFKNARMSACNLIDADFTSADFRDADLTGATLSRAIFSGARMDRIKATTCAGESADFYGCSLSDAKFASAVLRGAQFIEAVCVNADFAQATCDEANFGDADCSNARFMDSGLRGSRATAGTRFTKAVFCGARLDACSWGGAILDGAVFDGAVLDDADFSHVHAHACRFSLASAKGARFSRADLSGADLSTINLFKGSLRKACLDGASLRDANLFGVDFEGTRLSLAAIERSNIDRTLLRVRPLNN